MVQTSLSEKMKTSGMFVIIDLEEVSNWTMYVIEIILGCWVVKDYLGIILWHLLHIDHENA